MPMFEVVMKPTAMSRKHVKSCPEFLQRISAADKQSAANAARRAAEISGFSFYAITSVKEVEQ